MSEIRYEGAIHDLIGDMFAINDGYTIGMKLEHIVRCLPKRFFYYSTDEEIHATLTEILKTKDYYKDEYTNQIDASI